MLCPFCKSIKSKVIDSRSNNGGSSIRRRRECLNRECKRRFTTYEQVVRTPPLVIKRDSKRETFEREKIYKGIVKACDKRTTSASKIEEIIDSVENTIYEQFEREVPSQAIGELIINKLKDLDQVAYVRFASVYRRFEDISGFHHLIQKLVEQKKDPRCRV
jgi:transcriptional repressor NrdR